MLACHRGGGGGGYLQDCGGICDLNKEFVLDSSEQNPEGPQIPPVVYTGDKSSRCISCSYLQIKPRQGTAGVAQRRSEGLRSKADSPSLRPSPSLIVICRPPCPLHHPTQVLLSRSIVADTYDRTILVPVAFLARPYSSEMDCWECES